MQERQQAARPTSQESWRINVLPTMTWRPSPDAHDPPLRRCRRSMAWQLHHRRGCNGQTWSVAEVLRTWVDLSMMKPQEQR